MSGRSNDTAKDRSAATVQITAEQLIRDASDRQFSERKDLKVKISDQEEAQEYTFTKRRSFENSIRNQRTNIGNYLKYAAWEESLHEFDRARSIYERALDIDYQNKTIWLRYADMETKHKFINKARNVYRRALTYLPRIDVLWYHSIALEEQLHDIAGARTLYSQWMNWVPNEQAWKTYINFEIRCGTVQNARKVYEQFIEAYATESSYISFAKWEEHQGQRALARKIFEKALVELTKDDITQALYIEFGKFEVRCHEYERARVIFNYGLQNLEKESTKELEKEYTSFQKQYGDNDEIETMILDKRRKQYEDSLSQNRYNYDVWFDYIHLEEDYGDIDKIRAVYERCISVIPPAQEKKYWRRYIYFWIYYALFEELIAEDIERTREVYKQCLNIIPHKIFTFAKIWIMFAEFELRQHDLNQARKIYGQALGICPKPKLFKSYIDMEKQLMNLNRCRVLYNKFIEYKNTSVSTWISYAEFEYELQEYQRMRSIFELGINQEVLDKPDSLWKRYIDIEIELDENDGEFVRNLYTRLLEKTRHPNIYISYAKFERSKNIEKGRSILNEGINYYKDEGNNECRALLLSALLNYEQQIENNDENIQNVKQRQPERVLKHMEGSDENEDDGEDYYDYIFPDDKVNMKMKLLEKAKLYKQGQFLAKRVKTTEDINIDDI